MFRRIPLWLKLSAAFFATILLSVTLVYFLTQRSLTQRFDAYKDAAQKRDAERFGQLLTTYWEEYRSWVGVDRLFYFIGEVRNGGEVVRGIVRTFETPFSFANENGQIILSTRTDIGRIITQADKNTIPIVVDGAQVGTLLFYDYVTPEQAAFLASATRSALVGGGITAGLGLALFIFLMAQILSPLRTLTRATESIAAGKAPQKVLLRSRDEIGQLGESFDHMVDNLRHSEHLRQTMTADIAHELRTPVTIIQGTLEAVLDGVYEPTLETIAPVYEETLHLGKLIDDLRELAMAEAGELRLERERVNIGQLVQQIIDATVPALDGAPEVRTTIVGDPPDAMVDPKRLRQIFANLLGNALRYTPPDGTVDVVVRAVGDEVEVSVSDTGPGITPKDLDHLFERFFRGDASRNRSVGGSGLGLAIVKQWVEAHGGRVWAENRPEGGARFTFWVPVG